MAVMYRANVLYNYIPLDSSQITLNAGDTLEVYDTDDSGWWNGYNEMTGERGIFPSTYVELVEDMADFNYYNQQSKKAPKYNSTKKAAGAMQDGYQYQETSFVPMGNEMSNYGSKKRSEQVIPLVESKAQDNRTAAKPGGGKEPRNDKPVCNTRYGFYASQMCRLNGVACVVVGAGAITTAAEAMVFMKNSGVTFSLLQLVVFLYCFVIGLLVFTVESFTKSRSKGCFPFRGLTYLIISGPLFITFYTLFQGVIFFIAAVIHIIATYKGEEVPAPKEEAQSKSRCCSSLCSVCAYQDRVKSGKLGKDVFMYLFILINLALFATGLAIFYPQIMPGGTLSQFTFMLPWAKAFGYGLDFTSAVIVLPVCRTFIRILYNYSTQDQTLSARALRSVLWLFPLDKALHFHEKTAMVILFLSFGHSFAHLVNAGLKWQAVISFYNWSPLLSGFLLWVVIFFMFPATVPIVKRGQFEIFWYSHQLFWLFFALNLIHGRNSLGPNYWKAFIGPGAIYLFERIYREYSAYQTVSVLSITNMKNNVLSIEFSRTCFPNGYLEGQYCFINCPSISTGQWHPFTISSAPGDPTVTLHIKIQGKNSWTRQLLEYFTFMGPKNASYFELADSGPNGIQIGKTTGPKNERMLMVYGPHSAPTQHAPEYTTDIIVGSGIGVTPVSATMQQIVYHRWKFNIGDSNPDHAYFVWVCSYNELETFRWMIRTVKECNDEVADLRLKSPESMGVKNFEVHIYVTSIPDDVKAPGKVEVDDDIGFWGRPRKPTGGVAKAREQYSELDIYKTMLYPPKGSPAVMGDIYIYNGRPNWDKLFSTVSERHVACKIGVAFCGNPRIGEDLKEKCTAFTNPDANQYFILHKENF